MEVEEHDLEYLGSHVSLAQCVDMLLTVQSMLTKLLEAMQKWSRTGLEEQSSALGAHYRLPIVVCEAVADDRSGGVRTVASVVRWRPN